MDDRKPPEYHLDIFTDRKNVKDIIRATLHVIFFHRYFTALTPQTHDILDTTLPLVTDSELETLIDQRADAVSSHFTQSNNRAQIQVHFSERRRRKNWYGLSTSDESVWEKWILDVTLAVPKSEEEVKKVQKAMQGGLVRTGMKIIDIVNRDRAHIPPITTSEANPFPYQIVISSNVKGDGEGRDGQWGRSRSGY